MQTQDLSYALNSHKVRIEDKNAKIEYLASVEVFSLENVYTVAEGTLRREGDAYRADELVWANTERVCGGVTLRCAPLADGTRFEIGAELGMPLRAVKLRLDGLPLGTLLTLTDEDWEADAYGRVIKYPEGWRSLSTPLLVFRLADGRYLYIRCLDGTVNAKRFFVKAEGGGMRVDIVQEQNGTQIGVGYRVPPVECGVTESADAIYGRHSDTVKETYGLSEYEHSSVKPAWLDEISLVVTMHMQAFTGYIFHTYAQAYEDVKKLTELVEGRHILVYLTGWEGRYYYKYGDYTPDERMGGAEALRACVEKLHGLGCKVMAMYGMNMANKRLPAVSDIVEGSEFESVSGAKFHSGSVDWEGAHHYDFGDLAHLNVANPLWGDRLFKQIRDATEKYGFDGAFLDIAACYVNDKNDKLYEGVVAFCDRLRTIKPDFLVSGEGYYDGLSRAMPLFQSGHTDGKLHYHDRADERLFTRFSREFAHLCIGDPSRGSTGVHEQGTNTDWRTPMRKGIIPTLALVEDSMRSGYERVKTIAADANEYARRYLNGETVQ